MSGTTHQSESRCPDCGHDEARVRTRGNAFSTVCTSCRRADVTPMLSPRELVDVEGELLDAELFELEAARTGQSSPLRSMIVSETVLHDASDLRAHIDAAMLNVELRLPVPPR